MWLGEGEQMRQERQWIAEGAPPRDLSSVSAWREKVEPENLELLDLYGAYLVGEYAGMTDALSIVAIDAVMGIVGTPDDEQPALARRLKVLHGIVRDIQRPKERESRG